MESKQRDDKIVLELTNEEAIVFYDWLSRFNEGSQSISIEYQAEERVLWDIEASLEKMISETFDRNYVEILSKAREKIKDK